MHVLGIILLVYPSLLIILLITASPSDTEEKRKGGRGEKKQPDSLILPLFISLSSTFRRQRRWKYWFKRYWEINCNFIDFAYFLIMWAHMMAIFFCSLFFDNTEVTETRE